MKQAAQPPGNRICPALPGKEYACADDSDDQNVLIHALGIVRKSQVEVHIISYLISV